ncbi:MAG: CZB domain-containing protein [Myxococcales bacterium]
MPEHFQEEIAAAITSHAQWIVDLSECLEGLAGGSPCRCQDFVRRIGAEDECFLGQWLHWTAATSQQASHRAVRELHQRFHEVASELVALALAGKADAATRLFEERLAPLSRQLISALDAWARVEALV